jgi:K+-transporting ATPase ATPase C chain
MTTKPIKQNPRQLISLIGVGLSFLCLLIVIVSVQRARNTPWEGFEKPDDVQVARERLSREFAGPRYFQKTAGSESPDLPFPFIATPDAHTQIEGILTARALPAVSREPLDKLVDSLAEPSPSRVVGAERVNVLQLNLALDEMRPANVQ